MKEFALEVLQLFRESHVTRYTILVGMGTLIAYVIVTKQEVPNELWTLYGLCVGYFIRIQSSPTGV